MEISGAVPTYWQTVIVEGRGNTHTTGETIIPRQTASGRVTFTNLTDEEITVPIGTVVSSADETPIRFATIEAITVPTGSEGVTTQIKAIQPGSTGNVSPEQIIAIEGPLGLNLTVVNNRATFGGSDFTTSAPTKADFERVYDELVASLQKTAMEEAQFRLEVGDILLSPQAELLQVLEEIYSPEVGEAADQLDLILRLEFQIPYARGEDMYKLGRAVLDRRIPEDFTPRPETLEISQLTEPNSLEFGKAIWDIQAAWKLGADLDEVQAVSLVIGLPPDKANQQLDEEMPIEGIPEVALIPEWWPRLPILPFRITVINQLNSPP